jgi:hypothetical protein
MFRKSLFFRVFILSLVSQAIFASAHAGIKTFSQMEQFLSLHPTATLNELLAQMDPEVMALSSVAYRSRAFLGADPKDLSIVVAPSVHLDEPKIEKLFLAFKADANGNHGNAMDVIRWNPANERTEFKTIEFSKSPSERSPVFLNSDPQFCAGCHESSGRVLWDASPAWPGMLGGFQPKQISTHFQFEDVLVDRIKIQTNHSSSRFGFLPGAKTKNYLDYVLDNAKITASANSINAALTLTILKREMARDCGLGVYSKSQIKKFAQDLDFILKHSNEQAAALESLMFNREPEYADFLKSAETDAQIFAREITNRVVSNVEGVANDSEILEFNRRLESFPFAYTSAQFSTPEARNSIFPLLYFLKKRSLPNVTLSSALGSFPNVFTANDSPAPFTRLVKGLQNSAALCR